MKVLVTAFNRDKKIQAIKGVRAVSQSPDLKATKDFIDGPLPAQLQCRSDLTSRAIVDALAEHGVVATALEERETAFLDFLGSLPAEMTVGHVRTVLSALSEWKVGP